MRKQTKIAALVSAAALLAIGASMTALAQPGWNIDAASGTATYHDRYDDPETDVWHTWTDGKYYYFGDDGYMVRSQLVDYNEDLYYVDSTGAKVTNQWVRLDNENGDTVGDNEVSNIYYFFSDGTGKAKVNGGYTVRINNNTTDTAKFFFDDQGRMLSGWQTIGTNTYYLGEETDGRAVTGWQHMEPNEEFEDPYAQDLVWYYFNNGGDMVKDQRKYLAVSTGAKYWFAFNPDGSMVDDNWSSVDIATANYGGVSVSAYYATDGYQRGTGWVQAKYDSDSDTKWFYLDAKGVPFNYSSTKATATAAQAQLGGSVTPTAYKWDAATKSFSDTSEIAPAAKVIKNKTYLFNGKGEMLTGVYRLSNVYREGSASSLGKGAKGEIYYFDTEAATEGAMATNKKIQTTSDDVTYNYSFDSNGVAAEYKIVNGTLYGKDGVRVDAEDTTWQVKTVAEIIGTEASYIESDKKETVKNDDGSTVTRNVQLTTSEKDSYQCTAARVIVNANGRVKESGTVIIDGVKYWVKSASEADSGVTGGIDGKAYLVVMEKSID